IVEELLRTVLACPRERVVGEQPQAAPRPPGELGLERGLTVVAAVAVVRDALGPPELLEEGLALIRRHVGETGQGWLVGIRVGRIPGEDVGALVSDVADLEREAVRELTLDGQVPRVDRG